MSDPFDDPAIAAEMKALLGPRFVCLADGCGWTGHYLNEVWRCPICGDAARDRWRAHARDLQSKGVD